MKQGVRRYFKGYVDFLGPFGAQRLSTPAQSMLICLLCQYDGGNNGALRITPSSMPARWRSNDTRRKARNELLGACYVYEMAQGHRPNVASLYAVACFPLDPHPRHDAELVAKFSMDAWRSAPPDVTTLHRRTSKGSTKRYTAGRPYADFATPPDVTASAPIAPPDVTTDAKSLHRRTSTFKDSTRLHGARGNGRSRP